MNFFRNLIYFIFLFGLVLTMLSCQHDSNVDELNPVDATKVPWEEYLDSKLTNSGWELSFGDEKGNFCQLGDGEQFPCDGGTCFITTDSAHSACVGCTVSDTRACTGSLGGIIFTILDQMAVDYPNVNIDYTLYDENDNVLDTIEGEIGTKMVEINSANQQPSVSKFDVKLSSN